jgi:hypothetical protein
LKYGWQGDIQESVVWRFAPLGPFRVLATIRSGPRLSGGAAVPDKTLTLELTQQECGLLWETLVHKRATIDPQHQLPELEITMRILGKLEESAKAANIPTPGMIA